MPPSQQGPSMRTRARSSSAVSRCRRRTGGWRRSPTRRARASASACSSTAPGASPARAGWTRRAPATRLPARPGSRAQRRPETAAALPRSSRPRARTRRRSSSDPFAVSLADKIELCLRAEEAARHPGVKVTSASARALLAAQAPRHLGRRRRRAGLVVECGAGVDALAAGDGLFQQRSYPSAFGGSSAQAGWEYVESLRLSARSRRASARRRRRSCAPTSARRPSRRSSSTPSRRRSRYTSRSGIPPSSTASTAPRPPTPAPASSRRATSARCATARS